MRRYRMRAIRRRYAARRSGASKTIHIISAVRPDLNGTWTFKVDKDQYGIMWQALQDGRVAKEEGAGSRHEAAVDARSYLRLIQGIAKGR